MVHFQVQAVARALLGVVRLRGAPRTCLGRRSPKSIRSWPSPRFREQVSEVGPSASSRKPVGVSRLRERRPPWRSGPSRPPLPQRPDVAPIHFSHHLGALCFSPVAGLRAVAHERRQMSAICPHVPLGTLRAFLDIFLAPARHRFGLLGPKISRLPDQSGTSPMVRTPQGCGDATCPSKDSHHRSFAPLAGSASHEVGLTFDVFGAAVAGCWVTCSLLGVWRPRGLSIRICTTPAVKRTKPPSLAFGSSSETDSGLVESGGCPHRSDTSPGVLSRSALSEHRVGREAPPSQRRSAIPSRPFADPQGFDPR